MVKNDLRDIHICPICKEKFIFETDKPIYDLVEQKINKEVSDIYMDYYHDYKEHVQICFTLKGALIIIIQKKLNKYKISSLCRR